jgi:hypothetical protein
MTALPNVKAIKSAAEGERVSFRARVLRVWETGGLRMALVGDASALTRIEIGDAAVEKVKSYEFRDAVVKQYPGGWTSASIADMGEALELGEPIEVPQDEAYIERTFKILSGIQRKKARREGRLPPWRHPSERAGE